MGNFLGDPDGRCLLAVGDSWGPALVVHGREWSEAGLFRCGGCSGCLQIVFGMEERDG